MIDFETEAELQMTVNYGPTTKYDDLVKVIWLGRKGAKFSSHVDPTGFHCQVTLKDKSVTATSTVSAAVARNIAAFMLLRRNDKIAVKTPKPLDFVTVQQLSTKQRKMIVYTSTPDADSKHSILY